MASTAIVFTLLTGCSFKAADPANGLHIRLKPATPQYQAALSVMDLAPRLQLESLSPLSGIGANLGCFIIGAGGGPLTGASSCAHFTASTTVPSTFSAQATSVDSSFTMVLPISDGMTFTGFGGFPAANGSCDANPADGGGFALLGQTTPSATALNSVVEIPVASAPQIGSCGSAPFQIFSDSLTGYTSTNGLTTANTGGAWTTPTGAAGALTSAGQTGITIPQNNNNPYYAALPGAIPSGLSYVSATATFAVSAVSSGDTTVSLVGFSDSLNTSSGDFVFCGLKIASSGPGYPSAGTVSIVNGDSSSYAGALGTTAFTTGPASISIATSYTIQCDVEFSAAGAITIFAHVTAGGSVTNYSYSSPTTFSGSSIYAVMGSQENGSGSTASGTITNYSVSAAETTQE